VATAEQVCVICGGSGWRIIERGGVSAAERCECTRRERSLELERRANIPPLYEEATFENFSLRQDNQIAHRAMVPVFSAVRSYARSFPANEKPGLLLIGPTGTGKTHLCIAALKVLVSRGFECVFFDFNSLIQQIRSSWDPASKASNRDAYGQAMEAEVLVLDDLGAHRTLDWIQDVLTSVITHRCNHRKPLIATTNLPDPDAGSVGIGARAHRAEDAEHRRTLGEWIGERARSRLFEMCHVIRMPEVEDYRIRGRK
jgi:DNA replication protein DnaC